MFPVVSTTFFSSSLFASSFLCFLTQGHTTCNIAAVPRTYVYRAPPLLLLARVCWCSASHGWPEHPSVWNSIPGSSHAILHLLHSAGQGIISCNYTAVTTYLVPGIIHAWRLLIMEWWFSTAAGCRMYPDVRKCTHYLVWIQECKRCLHFRTYHPDAWRMRWTYLIKLHTHVCTHVRCLSHSSAQIIFKDACSSCLKKTSCPAHGPWTPPPPYRWLVVDDDGWCII